MILPAVLYVLFALLATVGVYLAGAHFRSRVLGAVFALGTLLFFLGLALYVDWLVRMGQAPP